MFDRVDLHGYLDDLTTLLMLANDALYLGAGQLAKQSRECYCSEGWRWLWENTRVPKTTSF